MPKIVTHEDYVNRVAKINPNIEVVGTYINAKTKILHRCKIDGYEWMAAPNNISNGNGCPKCGGNIRYNTELYIDAVNKINENIIVCDEYSGVHTKILHKCRICNNEWMAIPASILNNHTGCPVCSGNIIGGAPEYKNSIWADKKYRDFFCDYMTEEQMKTNMPHGAIEVDMVCPICGRHKKKSPCQFCRNGGLGCVCSDGVSYPNKFVFSLLEQVGIDFIREYYPKWAYGKAYDFYIPFINTIIECHGIQHYVGWGYDNDNLRVQQQNDKYKMDLAINNGIENYIVLDCRESNVGFIKNSIINSKLFNLLFIHDYDIDWDECGRFASNNLVVDVSEMWDNGYSLGEIRRKTKLANGTITRYIKEGNKIGVCKCEYSTEESRKRGMVIPANAIEVYCLELNKVFVTQAQAERETKCHHIAVCCSGKRNTSGGYHWYYLYDKTMKNGKIIKGAITLGLISEEEAIQQLNSCINAEENIA